MAQDADSDYLNPTGIEARAKRLRRGIDKVLLYANHNLAHRTAELEPAAMIPKDTDENTLAVQTLFDKLYPLLTGKSMPDPTPVIQFDWEDAFRHASMPLKNPVNCRRAKRREKQADAVADSIKKCGNADE